MTKEDAIVLRHVARQVVRDAGVLLHCLKQAEYEKQTTERQGWVAREGMRRIRASLSLVSSHFQQ